MLDIAIYSRKSKFTGKGDSINNQIQMCKDYCNQKFKVDNYYIYEDEGYSGGDTERPHFQMMLKDAKAKKFQVVVCYKLDRISRNVSDFATTLSILQDYGISFVSVTEQFFDTSTPMGRAMIYIASVLAQLERETIAERVHDNMILLARTGRWLGGITPFGFKSEPLIITDDTGKKRKQFKLAPIFEEQKIVKLLYDKFLDLKSLTKLETFCIQNDIKTRKNVYFSRFALRLILNNPVYAIADKELYKYLEDNGFEIYPSEEKFDGKHGIMAYNKTIQKKHSSTKIRDSSEWIISTGAHAGIIEADKWIEAQELILKNKSKTYRKVKNTCSLLSGILRCGNCGSFMRPKYGREKKNKEKAFYYMCEMKEKSKRQKCSMKNINGNIIDKLVINEIKKLSSNDSDLYNKIVGDKVYVETTQDNLTSEIKLIEAQIEKNDNAISNLLNVLSQGEDKIAAKYILQKIDNLDKENSKNKDKLSKLVKESKVNESKYYNLSTIKDILINFSQVIDSQDTLTKRELIRTLVEKIIWDGKHIDIIMFGSSKKK